MEWEPEQRGLQHVTAVGLQHCSLMQGRRALKPHDSCWSHNKGGNSYKI